MNKNKKLKLTPEERNVEQALKRGEYVPTRNRAREIERARRIAKNTMAKTRAINVRIPERDLVRLRAAAMREGIPYQTYIASLIHKAVGK